MKKTAYAPLFMASLVLLGSFVVFGLEYYVLAQGKTQVMELQRKVEEKKVDIAKASRARNALATLGTSEDQVRSFLLQKDRIVSFLESLQATGKSLGTSVEVVSVSDDKQNGHPRINVSLLVSGSFDSVMRTVGTLENGPYDGVLNSLTLDSGGPIVKGVQQWSAATVLSVGLETKASTTPKKP